MSKKIITAGFVITIAIAFLGLSACSRNEPVVKAPELKIVSVPTVEEQAMKANADIKLVAKDVARKSKFKHPSACNSTPVELATLKAYKDFPLTGPATYKAACRDEIVAMKKDEARAIAQAEQQKKRLAAKKNGNKTASKKPVQHKG